LRGILLRNLVRGGDELLDSDEAEAILALLVVGTLGDLDLLGDDSLERDPDLSFLECDPLFLELDFLVVSDMAERTKASRRNCGEALRSKTERRCV
jgi:hypothetical protein